MRQVVTELCGGDVSAASSIQGYLSAVNAGTTLVTAALLGLISDRWGRIPCLLVSLVRLTTFHPRPSSTMC
jgi:MFS family permease